MLFDSKTNYTTLYRMKILFDLSKFNFVLFLPLLTNSLEVQIHIPLLYFGIYGLYMLFLKWKSTTCHDIENNTQCLNTNTITRIGLIGNNFWINKEGTATCHCQFATILQHKWNSKSTILTNWCLVSWFSLSLLQIYEFIL